VAIGGRHVGDDNEALDTYDVSALARDKKNRMVVAVRSANGVGGLIAAIDLTQEFGKFRCDRQGVAYRRRCTMICWSAIRRRARSRAAASRTAPARRWNYLVQRNAKLLRRRSTSSRRDSRSTSRLRFRRLPSSVVRR